MSKTDEQGYKILKDFANQIIQALQVMKGGYTEERFATLEKEVKAKALESNKQIMNLLIDERIDELSQIHISETNYIGKEFNESIAQRRAELEGNKT